MCTFFFPISECASTLILVFGFFHLVSGCTFRAFFFYISGFGSGSHTLIEVEVVGGLLLYLLADLHALFKQFFTVQYTPERDTATPQNLTLRNLQKEACETGYASVREGV